MSQTSLNKSFQNSGPLSKVAIQMKIHHFQDCMDHVMRLPYGRNSNRNDLSLVLSEQKGSCSSKHAFLKAIAMEQDIENVQLMLCIFKMNKNNTPGIGAHIENIGLDYLPEAHCFLRIDDKAIDLTNANSNIDNIIEDIIHEEPITPEQVSQYKVDVHQKFINDWIQEKKIPFSFENLWSVREKCIATLSKTNQQ